MKTKKDIKKKVAAKVARAKAKIARKCGKACVAAFALLSLVLTGCMGTTTPSRSQTLTLTECTINIYGSGDGTTNDVARVEIASQAMSIENSGTESQTSSPTQTTDVRPDVNLNYAQGGGITNRGAGGGSVKGVIDKLLDSLTDQGFSALASALATKLEGTVTIPKKDGTTVTATCKDGSCTFSDGTKVTAEDCVNCRMTAN